MSKNAKAVREAIEAKRLAEQLKTKDDGEPKEAKKEFDEDEDIGHYSSDYGDEEAPPQLEEEEEEEELCGNNNNLDIGAESSGYGEEEDELEANEGDEQEEAKTSNPLFMMTSGIG